MSALRSNPVKQIRIIALLTLSTLVGVAHADVILTIHGGHFEPQQLQIPVGVKTRVILRNQDAFPAEFESQSLSREVLVPGRGEVAFFVGPMEPGSYEFFNDFKHEMKGTVVVDAGSGAR